jgi:hypothetical protein
LHYRHYVGHAGRGAQLVQVVLVVAVTDGPYDDPLLAPYEVGRLSKSANAFAYGIDLLFGGIQTHRYDHCSVSLSVFALG